MSDIQRITVLWPVGPHGYGNYPVVLASEYDKAQSELAALREELHNARNAASESHALIESYERGKKAAEQRNAELVGLLRELYWNSDITHATCDLIEAALNPTESGASE